MTYFQLITLSFLHSAIQNWLTSYTEKVDTFTEKVDYLRSLTRKFEVVALKIDCTSAIKTTSFILIKRKG